MSDQVDYDRPFVQVDTSQATSTLEDSVIQALEDAGFDVAYDAQEDAFGVQYTEGHDG